jgi:hypothetical protein
MELYIEEVVSKLMKEYNNLLETKGFSVDEEEVLYSDTISSVSYNIYDSLKSNIYKSNIVCWANLSTVHPDKYKNYSDYAKSIAVVSYIKNLPVPSMINFGIVSLKCINEITQHRIDPLLHISKQTIKITWNGEYWTSAPRQKIEDDMIGKFRISIHSKTTSESMDVKQDYYSYTFDSKNRRIISQFEIESEESDNIYAVEFSYQTIPIICIPFQKGCFSFWDNELDLIDVCYHTTEVTVYTTEKLSEIPIVKMFDKSFFYGDDRSKSPRTPEVQYIHDRYNDLPAHIKAQGGEMRHFLKKDFPIHIKDSKYPKSVSLYVNREDIKMKPKELLEKYSDQI